MSKQRRSGRRRAVSTEATAPARARPDWPVVALAVAGIVVTSTLVWSAVAEEALPYCDAGTGCDLVQSSRWSRFLGLPLSVWGLGSYLALALAAAAGTSARQSYWTALVAGGGALFSLYLTAVSLISIGATCTYCLASAGILLAAAAWSLREWRSIQRQKGLVVGVTTAIIAALALHLQATGKGPGAVDPYLADLARHLEARGIRFYGADWCPHCQEQKAVFGGAADLLPYVECAPNGPNAARATACEMAGIMRYPTWIIDGRKVERLLPAEQLAALSGFRRPTPATAE